MIKGKCGYEGCQYDIRPAETQAKFNRNRGVHLRIAHGVIGAWKTPEGRRKFYENRVKKGQLPVVEAKLETEPIDPESSRRQHRLEYQAAYRERRKRERQQQLSSINNNAAKLKFICPDCGARIFTTSAP